MANFFSADYWKAFYFKAMGGQETAVDPNAISGSFSGAATFTAALTATLTILADDGSPAQRPARPEEIRKYREQRDRAERALREHADRLAGWKAPQEERAAPVTSPLELVELPAVAKVPSGPWRLPEPIATPPAKPARQGRRAPVETVDVAAIEAALAAERAFVALQREAQLQAAIQAAEIEAARRREEEAIIVLLLAA